MKLIGKIVTVVVMLALIACAGINTYIHVKSGEIKNVFKNNNTQVEQPAKTPTESPAEKQN